MRISGRTLLHLSPVAAVGGCEVNCLRVIEGLPHYDHRVLIFDREGPMSEKWTRAGARVEHLGQWAGSPLAFRSALGRWRRSQSRPEGIFYWSTSRLPLVLSGLRDWKVGFGVYLGNPVAGGRWAELRRRMEERIHPASTRVTLAACSHQVAASHRRSAYFRRFRVEVIYNAVGGDFDRPRRHRLLPPGSAPRIGMVARLDRIKDHSTLIRALAAITPERPDLVVEFAGDGALRAALQQESQRLGVADRVRFLGFVEVQPRLAEWDLYIHSTTDAEGMGTAVAEAMATALPCVVSDLPVMREVCGEGAAAYFPPGDAAALGRSVLELLALPERRAALGDAGQKRARAMFALPQVASAYLQLILPQAGEPSS